MKISLSVLEAIATYLTIQHSRINRFAADLYTQSARIEECSRAIIELLWRMLHDVHAAVRNQFLSEFLHGIIYLLLTHKETSPSFFEKVFKRALVELDEGTRALILQDMKLKVESKILQRGAPEHYERIWLDNIHNYANVVLYGRCTKCLLGSPVIIPLLEYFAKYSDEDLSLKCTRCNTDYGLSVGISSAAKYLPEDDIL
jgi:hypothetical protein